MADNVETTTLSDAEYEALQRKADGAPVESIFGNLFAKGLETEMKKKFTEPGQVQEVDELVGTLKDDKELSTALRDAIADDGSVIRGMMSATEADLAAVNDALAAPGGTNRFVDALKKIAANPDDHITFDSDLRPLFAAAVAGPTAAPSPDAAPAAPASHAEAPAQPGQEEPANETPDAPSITELSPNAFIGEISKLITSQDQSPEMRAAANDLTQTLKANPALTAEIQKAAADPNFMDTLLTGSGDSSALEQVQDLNETLQNPDNVVLLTKTLDAVTRDPNDNIDFSLVRQMTDLGKKQKSGKATQDDYKAMNAALAGAGIVDKRIEMMEDPSKIWKMFLDDPQEMVRMMMNEFSADIPPEFRDMIAGTMTVFAQMASAFVDPNGDFIGYYNKNLIQPIGASISAVGAETMGGATRAQYDQAGVGAPATSRDLGSNISIEDDRREAILSNGAAKNAFAGQPFDMDPAELARQRAAIDGYDAQLADRTQAKPGMALN